MISNYARNRSQKYILRGDPIPHKVTRNSNDRVWDPQRQAVLISTIELQQQHAGKPLFTGILEIDIAFYFKVLRPHPKNPRRTFEGDPHTISPDLDSLIEFVKQCMSHNLLIANNITIISQIARKLYDNEPRTEIIITELVNEK